MRALLWEADFNRFGDVNWRMLGEVELIACTDKAFKAKLPLRDARWYIRTWFKYEEISECKNCKKRVIV